MSNSNLANVCLILLTCATLAQAQISAIDEECRHPRNVVDRADTALTASVAEDVKNNTVAVFSNIAVDVKKFRKELSDQLDAYERAHRDKEGWDAAVFGNKKAEAINELNVKLAAATQELAVKVDLFGKDLGSKIETAINNASPNLTGLAQYDYCKSDFDPGKPGWSQVGKLGISGVNYFSGSGTLDLGPIDMSLSFKVPGFAELKFSGTLKYSITGSVSGALTADSPSNISPVNRPIASSSALVDFPITGGLSAETKTGIIGAAGDLAITVNHRIGPVKLKYEAKEDNK